MRDEVIRLVARHSETGGAFTLAGREAWELHAPIKDGERGCTPINNPLRRSQYASFLLRRRGLLIETISEAHDGVCHGRHSLRTRLSIVAVERAGGRHHAA